MRLIFHIHFFVAKMTEIGIKQVYLCMFLCKLKYKKMPRILQLRPRISAMSASRFFFTFWPRFSQGSGMYVKKF